MWPPAAAALLLAALIALRFIFPEPDGIMLLAVVPIILLGMMLGANGGIGAALVASVAYLIWAATEGHPDEIDTSTTRSHSSRWEELSGFFARGVLGAYDWQDAMASSELRGAMDREELVMHFQPIVRRGRALLGVELVAGGTPNGVLPPVQFVPSRARRAGDLGAHGAHARAVDPRGGPAADRGQDCFRQHLARMPAP